jgi:hypothetical protein
MAWNVLSDGSFYDQNDAIVHRSVHAGFFILFLFALSAFFTPRRATIHSPIIMSHVTFFTILRTSLESVVDGEERFPMQIHQIKMPRDYLN